MTKEKQILDMKSFENIVETSTFEEFKDKIYTFEGKKIDETNGRVERFDLKNKGNFYENTVENYLKELSSLKPLKEEEILELLKKVKNGDIDSRETLIEGMLKLVAQIALRYSKAGTSYIELIQEGIMGIAIAIENYDLNSTMDFLEYMKLWIKYQMINSNKGVVEELKNPIITYFKHLKIELYKENNEELDPVEVEKELGICMEEFENLEKINSYGFLIGEEDRRKIKEYKNIAEIDSELEKLEKLMSVSNLANKFTTREIEMLELYYGLNGKRKFFEEIGKIFDISPENVKEEINKLTIKLKYDGKREWIDEN